MSAVTRLNARSNDILRNRDLILAHDSRTRYANTLRASAEAYAQVDAQLSWREQAYRLSAGLIADIGRIGVLIGALLIVLTTSSEVENIGDAYFIVAIYYRMLFPTQELVGAYANFRRARQSLRSSRPCSTTRHQVRYNPPLARTPACRCSNLLPGGELSYATVGGVEEDGAVLDRCTFEVQASHTTLLLGRSGAGKTTIARMILGVVEPSSGEVWVGGERITRDTNLEDLHARFSYLAQEEHIVDDKVRANLFPHDHDDAALVDVLRRVGLRAPRRQPTAPRTCSERTPESFPVARSNGWR